jgi:hypothetical protein
MNTVTLDPLKIINTPLFKFILAYIFMLEIVASQTPNDKTIFKNIFIRIITIGAILFLLEFPILYSFAYSLGITIFFFFLAEK